MKSFIQFVQEEFQRLKQKRERTEFIKSLPKSFREYVLESLDSSYDIIKIETHGNLTYFYFKINEELFRIFVLKSSDYSNKNKEVEIGFEHFNGVDFTIFGMSNKLNNKEVLGIFGTIKEIIKKNDFDTIFVASSESKKHRLYLRICSKLGAELKYNFVSHNEGVNSYIKISKTMNDSGYLKFKQE